MIHIKNLNLSFGAQALYKNLSAAFNDQQHIGLVGRNGTGKSTLLKLIYDAQFKPNPAIALAKHRTIGYLPQDVVLQSNKTIFEETFTTFEELHALKHEALELEEALKTSHDDKLIDRYTSIQERLVDFHPDRLAAETKKVLMGLGFKAEQFDQPVDALSVGWKMRIVLAKLLLKKADFYLFDEPTNHLDIVAKDWFLNFLKTANVGFIMVSHERYFLNKLCDYIFELELGNGTQFTGNYDAYERQKAASIERLVRAYDEQQREIKKKQATIDKFRAKASKAKMAQSMMKQLEKIELIELPPGLKDVHFSFQPTQKAGRIILTITNLAKSFGDKQIFENVSFAVERGQKVAIVAANGVGKTTLFNCLVEKFEADKGFIEFGYNVVPTIFEQDQTKALDLNSSILENIEENHGKASEKSIRSFLGNFLFTSDDVHKKVKVLSGGEKNKVGMTNVLLSDANFLLLDEPTNHLDMPSKKALLNALQEYPGTILFVSHDHDFINHLATHIIELTPHGAHKYTGNYEDFLQQKKEAALRQAGLPTQKLSTTTTSEDKPNDYEKNKRIKAAERKIAKLETAIEKIQFSFADLEYGTSEFTDAQKELDALQKDLAATTKEWEVLTSN